MNLSRATLAALVLAIGSATVRAAEDYPPGPDSKAQPGVPKGDVLKFTFSESRIFPGTRRDYWVYVPAEYAADKPACVYVGQDGIGFNAPTVFDNLIFRKEIPVTIGVFIQPGVVPAADTNALDRFNRSYEYDGLGDNYARFLTEEVLPAVEKIILPDGRALRLSHEGNDRCLGGASSGGICAFTAAWERPEEFSRVFSAIGTYVDLRGGARYPTLIRKFEPKPIRVFLQDGTNDLNIYGGDWWLANQTMARALEFSGYEVTHAWGDGGHNGKQAEAVFPEAMRWLWKDWPQPVKGGPTRNEMLSSLLLPGEGWQTVCENLGVIETLAPNTNGEVFFNDVAHQTTFKIGVDGTVGTFLENSKRRIGQFGPDGKFYSAEGLNGSIFAYDESGRAREIARPGAVQGLVVARNGNVYATALPPGPDNPPGQIWLIKPGSKAAVADSGLKYPNGITLSPDQSLLYVADRHSHWVYSFVVQANGTLVNKQRYDWLHERDEDSDADAGGLRVDRAGRLYVATRLGIQVCDQAGRVQCILPVPHGQVRDLCFGGETFDTLFAACGDKILKRKLRVNGANAWAPPYKPAAPHL
jgi:enterochelin esterase-like enzyme